MHSLCARSADKWQNGWATLGHGLVAFEIMAGALAYPRVDACLLEHTLEVVQPQRARRGELVRQRPQGGPLCAILKFYPFVKVTVWV